MKIANGFKLKILQGKDGEGEKGVIVTVGEATKKLNGIISLNEQATLIFKCIDKGFTKEQIVEEMLKNPQYPAPKVIINPEVKDFYKFTVDDFQIIDYNYNKLDKKFEVAI